MKPAVPQVLTFSASDPTSGAGMQADALTLAAMSTHPLTVLTGVTAQNTVGVARFESLAGDLISAQLDSLLEDGIRPAAIKIGVLGSAGAIDAVLKAHHAFPEVPIVLDPVLASGRGDDLGQAGLIGRILNDLLPITTLITPNWPEGKQLTGKRANHTVADSLLSRGAGAVLLKGEHQSGQNVVNRLFEKGGGVHEFPTERFAGQFHGSGCTLASACAAGLAHGLSLREAVELGLAFTLASLVAAFPIGKGQLIPDRMHLMQQAGGAT